MLTHIASALALTAAVVTSSVVTTGGVDALDAVDRARCADLALPLTKVDDTATPVGDPDCPGARPGAAISLSGSLCSLGFMFTQGSTRYFATAGHCVVSDGVERTWGSGPLVRTASDYKTLGNVVYAVNSGDHDIAIIRVSSSAVASPEMCHFGGPTALAPRSAFEWAPSSVAHYGQGRYYRDMLRARTGASPADVRREYVSLVANVGPGDSGSPVIDARGRALGIMARALVEGSTGAGAVYAEASRLADHLDRVRTKTGLDLQLATAPLHSPLGALS